jgi:hypothetical protein
VFCEKTCLICGARHAYSPIVKDLHQDQVLGGIARNELEKDEDKANQLRMLQQPDSTA